MPWPIFIRGAGLSYVHFPKRHNRDSCNSHSFSKTDNWPLLGDHTCHDAFVRSRHTYCDRTKACHEAYTPAIDRTNMHRHGDVHPWRWGCPTSLSEKAQSKTAYILPRSSILWSGAVSGPYKLSQVPIDLCSSLLEHRGPAPSPSSVTRCTSPCATLVLIEPLSVFHLTSLCCLLQAIDLLTESHPLGTRTTV